jgi:hypothetical protein
MTIVSHDEIVPDWRALPSFTPATAKVARRCLQLLEGVDVPGGQRAAVVSMLIASLLVYIRDDKRDEFWALLRRHTDGGTLAVEASVAELH